MSDPILVARLRALWDDLGFVRTRLQQPAWLSDTHETPAEMQLPALWNGLTETLVKQIDRERIVLSKIMQTVTDEKVDDEVLTTAWMHYDTHFQKSQDILRECFEIIGTLAIRNSGLDEQVLAIADELVGECLVLSTHYSHYYLLVPGVAAAFSKAVSRILRLRFPEWTIWHLPLVAHELGHVIVTGKLEEDELMEAEMFWTMKPDFVKREEALLALAGWQIQLTEGKVSAAELERWAKGRVHEFYADAFATYTMGPAYACSAILLRLDPSAQAHEGIPSDAQRVHVILSMLRWMSKEEGMTLPYHNIADVLQTRWDQAMARVACPARPTPECEAALTTLAEGFGENRNLLREPARYSGHSRATELGNTWRKEMKARQPLSRPEWSAENKLRDVLNTTWALRLEVSEILGPKDISEPIRELQEIHDAGRKLCKSIIAARRATQADTKAIQSVGSGQ